MRNKPDKIVFGFVVVLIYMLIGCNSIDSPSDMNSAIATSIVNEQQREVVVYGFDGKIWQMNLDGTNNEIIVETDFPVSWPKVSPDSSQILMIGRKENKMSLWVAGFQGEDIRQISSDFDAISGYWINSTTLLVSITTDTGLEYGNPENYFVLDINSNNMEPYPDSFEGGIGKIIPSKESWVTSFDGGLTLHNLNEKPQFLFPDWVIATGKGYEISPSGQEIIFQGRPLSSSSEDIEYNIYRGSLDINQEPEKILEKECCVDFYWSPDEQKIVLFSSNNDNVTVINSQTYETLLIFNLDINIQEKYDWSLNNKEFLISADYSQDDKDRNFELAKINMDTGEVIRLTNNEKRESGVDLALLK
ncbi:MAG: hypothetical protein GY797_19380 [Deltaproteobacteria bacterium]|nr:hypothetical protein [Deltaproteobacteria bacterium]